MITQRDLVQRLTRRDPGAWSVVERIQDTATAEDPHSFQRRDHRTRLTLIVHHDVPRGRGSARLDLDAFDGTADDLVDQAIALALTAVGPTWLSTPAAAPAKVVVLDDDLRELDAAARGILGRLLRPAGVTTRATIAILREKTTIVASSGFQTTWLATSLRADAQVALGPHQLTVVRTARRAADLDLDAALAAAAADLLQLPGAAPPVPGPCALWLGPDAILHGGDLGLWSIFAHQADAAVERQGLTRFRLHAELAPGAAQLPDPLSITSDGALDFATRSLPITDDAVAIRRFPLVDRGLATGLGLSPREAALRHTDPNGGVRNLVVNPGTWSPPSTSSSPSSGASPPRLLEVRRLHALAIDPYTGDATLDIAFGLDHRLDPRTGRAIAIAFTGGSIRLDLITALARARRSSQLLRRGAYHGPADLLIDATDLLT
ncbi:MAG: metallopeptidase TldD-related protein [Minicystis sp.]